LSARPGAAGGVPASGIKERLSNLNAAVLDAEARPIDAVRRLSGEEEADHLDAVLRTSVRNAGQNRSNMAINDGILTVDGSLRMTAPRVLNDAFDILTPAQQKLYTDGIQAMRLLDDIDEAVAEGKVVNNLKQVRQDLDDTLSRARRDENVLALTGETKRIGNKILEYNNVFVGTVSNTKRHQLSQRRVFLPRQEPRKPFLTRAGEWLENLGSADKRFGIRDQTNPYLQWREHADINDRINAHFNPPSDTKPPDVMREVKRYVEANIKHGGENFARRAFVDAIKRGDAARGDGKSILRPLPKGKMSSGNVLRIWRNGAHEDYEVGDRTVYKSLLFRPHYTLPVVSSMRKIVQAGTTGALRPFFALKSLSYDAGFMALSGRTDRMYMGRVDQKLGQLLEGQGVDAKTADMVRAGLAGITRAPDVPVTVLEGFNAGMKGRVHQELVRHAQKNLAAAMGNDIAKMPDMQIALNDAMDKFQNTKYAMLMRTGYTSQMLKEDWGNIDLWDRLTEKVGDTQGGRAYTGMLDNVRDAARMGMFVRNVAAMELKNGNRPLTATQLRMISRNVREIAADPTRMGSSPFVSGFLSAIPYGNIILQSAVHMIRSTSNPAFYSVLGTVTAYRVAMSIALEHQLGPEESQKLREESPAYKYGTGFPTLTPEAWADWWGGIAQPTRHDVMWVPLSPELGMISNSAESVVRGLLGVEFPNEASSSGVIFDGFANLLNFGVPPIANVLTSAIAGQKLTPHVREGSIQFFTPPLSGNPNEETGADRRGLGMNGGWITDRISDILSSAFGSTGQTIADALEISIDAPTAADQTFFEQFGSAMGVIQYDIFQKEAPNIPIIGSGYTERDSAGTPLANRYYELENYLDVMHDEVNRAMDPGGRVGEVTNPSGRSSMKVPKISDRDLRRQVQQVEAFFDHPVRKTAIDRISIERRKGQGERGNYALNKSDQARVSNYHNDKVQAQYRKVMAEYGEFEEKMQGRWGPDWSLNGLARSIKRDRKGLMP
jgi:hypothetical protein